MFPTVSLLSILSHKLSTSLPETSYKIKVWWCYSSFIHQIFIETSSPLGYSSEHKGQRFLFSWCLYSVSFPAPDSSVTSWYLERKSKFLCTMGTGLSGPGFLWGFGSHLASHNPTAPCQLVSYWHSFTRWSIPSLGEHPPQLCSAPFGKIYMCFKIQESRVTKTHRRRNRWS